MAGQLAMQCSYYSSVCFDNKALMASKQMAAYVMATTTTKTHSLTQTLGETMNITGCNIHST
jgi:hypothetical protein